MTASYVPKRGDAVWINFDPHVGREQAGRRPALVLSPLDYNRRVRLAVFCPITSQRKGYPFEVPIPHRLRASGVILSDQLKSLDWQERNAELICSLPEATVMEVLDKISALINPDSE